jgi:hypothetical protein
MVNKLQLSKKEANHKIRILRQKLQRVSVNTPFAVVDFTGLDVEDGEPDADVRAELAVLQERERVEDDRLRRLVHGSGQGRPKLRSLSLQPELFLQGCSARAAKDQILVAAGLFLPFHNSKRSSAKSHWNVGSGRKERDWAMKLGSMLCCV